MCAEKKLKLIAIRRRLTIHVAVAISSRHEIPQQWQLSRMRFSWKMSPMQNMHTRTLHASNLYEYVAASASWHCVVSQFNYIYPCSCTWSQDVGKNAMRQAISHNRAACTQFNISTADAKLLLFMERDPAANEHLCTFVLSIYSHQSFHFIHTHFEFHELYVETLPFHYGRFEWRCWWWWYSSRSHFVNFSISTKIDKRNASQFPSTSNLLERSLNRPNFHFIAAPWTHG